MYIVDKDRKRRIMITSTPEPLIHACRHIDPEPIADLALGLMRIWSPPGSEAQMAERMGAELTAIGARVRLDHEYPNSPSVIAEFGTSAGPTLQWHGHLDAVDLAHAEPAREGTRLTGRGAADMKGPLASMVTAARLLIERDFPGRVLITLHGMHESGGNEPLHELIARGVHGDAVITGELGGGQDLPIAGLGLSFWEITVAGPLASVHEVVATTQTIDPVEVGRIIHGELAGLRDCLAGATAEKPLPSLFVGRFVAGDYVNRIPVSGSLSGTRRHDSGMTPAQVEEELRAIVGRVSRSTGADITLDVVAVADSFEVDPGERLVVAMQDAHRDLTGRDLPVSRSKIASNAVHFVREAGVPAVGYGPDPISNHSDFEFVEVADLARVAAGFALGTVRYFDSEGSASA